RARTGQAYAQHRRAFTQPRCVAAAIVFDKEGRRMFKCMALILSFASVITAADVSGTWSGMMGSTTEADRIFLTLKQDGQTISGTIAYFDESKPVPIEKAQLNENVLSFEVHDNPRRVVRISLTFSGVTLKGEATTSGDQVLPVNLTRRSAAL